jgi:single-strand DNA-binding protein
MTAQVTIVGNLSREVELRYTQGGAAVAKFSVAVNRRFQKAGEWTEEVSFFECVAWAQLAENAASSLTKGDRVVVNGRLSQRSYEHDGQKRSSVEITAENIGPDLRWATASVERTERTTAIATAPAAYSPEESPF